MRSTQFFEFLAGIAQAGIVGETARLSPALFQPIASDDVVAALADIAAGAPLNATVEVAGPDPVPLDDLVRRYLSAIGDMRKVVADTRAPYFGAVLNDRSLNPGDHPRIGALHFDEWLSRSASQGTSR